MKKNLSEVWNSLCLKMFRENTMIFKSFISEYSCQLVIVAFIFSHLYFYFYPLFQIQLVYMLIVVEMTSPSKKIKETLCMKETEELKVALQSIPLMVIIFGDLVALETSWMTMISKIHVTLYIWHLQICLIYTRQHVYPQFQSHISITA